MPIFYQHHVDLTTKLAIWKIDEGESYFNVPLHLPISHPHKRLQHLSGRYLLKQLYHDFPLDLIEIADTKKPYLPGEKYHFSISHCADFVAAIVSEDKRVGIDIEVSGSKVFNIRHKFLNDSEWAYISKTKDQKQLLTQLTLAWSCKEAIFKWWSFGGVDFSNMILLHPFELKKHGIIYGDLHIRDKHYLLQLNYIVFDGFSLAWVSREVNAIEDQAEEKLTIIHR